MALPLAKPEHQHSNNERHNKGFAANDPRYDQGDLSKGFNWSSLVVPALVSVATFCVMGYIDNAIFDVFFFDPIHVSENGTSLALKNLMLDKFGWIHEMTGFTGDGGFLHNWPFDGWLAPYYPQESVDLTSALSSMGVSDVGVEAATGAVGATTTGAVEAVTGSTDYIDSMMDTDYSEYEY